MIIKSASGSYNHGIFVGKQNVAGTYESIVADFCGVRNLDDFAADATLFAKADYTQALKREQSVALAMKWVEKKRTIPVEPAPFRKVGFTYAHTGDTHQLGMRKIILFFISPI